MTVFDMRHNKNKYTRINKQWQGKEKGSSDSEKNETNAAKIQIVRNLLIFFLSVH